MLIHDALDLERALDQGEFSSVGSYPLYFGATNGDHLHPKCVREVAGADPCPAVGEWVLAYHDANLENPDLECAHCGERIESAYAEPAEES